MDLLAQLRPFGAVSHGRIERMCATVETDVGTEEGARADGDEARVDDDTVEVDEDALAQPHVEAVVDVDGRLDPGLALEQGLVCRWVI